MGSYFSYDDLTLLKGSENKQLKSVLYHFWQNKTNPSDFFEFTDKVELHFSDGTKLVLSSTEDDEPAISVLKNFDAETSKLELLHRFGGKIDQRTEIMTSDPLWKNVSGKTLAGVQLVDDGENTYRNDAVLLDFRSEKIEIRPGVEGLIIEPFEDV
ncbi:MAG TPA: hypothetical protein VFU15_09165 [Bacteroidia bacterium]|nr:hypothetical protein [Bacteroidia bacterium]